MEANCTFPSASVRIPWSQSMCPMLLAYMGKKQTPQHLSAFSIDGVEEHRPLDLYACCLSEKSDRQANRQKTGRKDRKRERESERERQTDRKI
jgi:hypothetical protein